jgi:NDP-sugar pyrophosphorylase family protein
MNGLLPVAILSGGLATRLRPMTDTIPKALIDINGEPFIVHQLRLLAGHGIQRAVVCIGHLGQKIIQVIGDGKHLGIAVTYSFDGPQLLGTAGAIKRAAPKLGDAFFVIYGDSYLECDYAAVQQAFQARGKMALMTVYRNESRYGASNVEYAFGEILTYDKQKRSPRMQHIDFGLGVFSRSAFQGVSPDKPCDLETIYQDMLKQNQLAAFEVDKRFYEVGSPAGIAELRNHLAAKTYE